MKNKNIYLEMASEIKNQIKEKLYNLNKNIRIRVFLCNTNLWIKIYNSKNKFLFSLEYFIYKSDDVLNNITYIKYNEPANIQFNTDSYHDLIKFKEITDAFGIFVNAVNNKNIMNILK